MARKKAKIKNQRLTPQQQKFAHAYVKNGGNASQAAAEAGYKHPHSVSTRLLNTVGIKKALARVAKKIEKRAILTIRDREVMLAEIAKTAKNNSDRIHALDILNRMGSVYVVKTEDVTSYETLDDEDLLKKMVDELLADKQGRAMILEKLRVESLSPRDNVVDARVESMNPRDNAVDAGIEFNDATKQRIDAGAEPRFDARVDYAAERLL